MANLQVPSFPTGRDPMPKTGGDTGRPVAAWCRPPPIVHCWAKTMPASWAKFAPGIKSSAGKTKGNGSTGHGNRYLARVLGETALGAGRTDTFLGARYRRIAHRRGRKRALVAVGRSQLVIIWHLLHDPKTRYHDLGVDHYDRHIPTAAKKRNHIKAPEVLGYHVTLQPAA